MIYETTCRRAVPMRGGWLLLVLAMIIISQIINIILASSLMTYSKGGIARIQFMTINRQYQSASFFTKSGHEIQTTSPLFVARRGVMYGATTYINPIEQQTKIKYIAPLNNKLW